MRFRSIIQRFTAWFLPFPAQDINEAHLAQADMASFKSTLDQTLDAVFIIDPETLMFSYVNQGACDQLGYQRDELLAMHPYDVKPEFSGQSFRKLIDPLLHGEQETLCFETIHRTKDDRDIPVEIFLQYVKPSGEKPRLVNIAHDIRRLKAVENELRQANESLEARVQERTSDLMIAKEEAEAASCSKNLFLSSMSHELRTPLNAIIGYAQLMQFDPDMPKQSIENAAKIKGAGDDLLALLNDVIDLSRIDSGRMDFQTQTVDLDEVMKKCYAQNIQSAESANIALVYADRCCVSPIKADRNRLLQLLNQLVSNAIKYNRDSGKVTISCESVEHDRIRISVNDTGPGIAPDKQALLFQPINRLGNEMRTIKGSTGIGLVIAKQLAERMGGAIGCKSTPGIGSTFWVEMPACQNETAAQISASVLDKATTAGCVQGNRILAAEDDALNQAVLRLQLERLGCEVEMVPNGKVALERWKEGQYALILTDLNMPVMDGLALAQAVRQHEKESDRHTPIIMVTAANEPSELKHYLDAGVDDVISKPVAIEELSRVIVSWVTSGEPTDQQPFPSGQDEAEDDATLNLDHLYRILGKVSIEHAREFVGTFIHSAEEGLKRLSSSPADGAAIARELHKQKSSARTIGALHYAKLAEELEQQAKAGNSVTLEVLHNALGEVKDKAEPIIASQTHGDGLVDESPEDELNAFLQCESALVIDDDPVILRQVSVMLDTLGVKEVQTADDGLEALQILRDRGAGIAVLFCDLSMPEMDGIELIRQIGQTGFHGGVILMSGADEKVLSTVSELAQLQGLRVFGQLKKPVTSSQITALLAHLTDAPIRARQNSAMPESVSPKAIRQAMARDEFTVWFQPTVDVVNLIPTSVEALARWRRPDGSFIPPDIFITMAEEEGLIAELSEILVAKTLVEGGMLHDAGFNLKIALNLSGKWLNNLQLPDTLFKQTALVGLSASNVILEITETGILEDWTLALDVLTRLRLKGFGLSIDDFGIGYSSFDQLRRIPFTELKLDRSFVIRGNADASARAILESSMDMAFKLGLSTVAEGVETEEHLELIRGLGCDYVQGYLIAKPMPADDLLVWLHDRG